MKKTTTRYNAVVRTINNETKAFDFCNDELAARWAKVYREEVNQDYKEVCEWLKEHKEDKFMKDERYRLECVKARAKSIVLTEEETATIKQLKEEYGFDYDSLNHGYLEVNLAGTDYVNEEGILMEARKDKETGAKIWRPVERWTILKLGRYYRMAFTAGCKKLGI